MQSVTITYDQAVDLLNKAVEARGADYVYKRVNLKSHGACLYYHDEEPGCIIGWILNELGFTRTSLLAACAADTPAYGDGTSSPGVHWLIEKEIVVCDDRTSRLLIDVQASQDSGTSWGEAVRRGIRDTAMVPVQ